LTRIGANSRANAPGRGDAPTSATVRASSIAASAESAAGRSVPGRLVSAAAGRPESGRPVDEIGRSRFWFLVMTAG
jgi:hypothetical protein